MKKYDKLIREAKQAFEKHHLEDAASFYEEAFKYEVKISDYIMLGYIYIDLGKYQIAEDMFQKINDLEDNDESNYALANIYERTNRKNKAIETYENIKNKAFLPSSLFSLGYLYDELAEENNDNFESENIQKAIKYYQRFLELEENDFWGHINLGSIYERFNYNEEALKHFLMAHEIDKDMNTACFNLGVVYNKLKDYDKALEYYLEELTKEGFYLITYYNLGILYKDHFNDYEKAKYYYLKGLEEDQDNYDLWYNLGCIHVLLNDYSNAFDCFKYLYYKQRKYIEYMEKDKELTEFRKTQYYQELKNEKRF